MDSLLCIVLYLYGWLSCLNYTLGNSWWFLPRLVLFFNCLSWAHSFQRLSLSSSSSAPSVPLPQIFLPSLPMGIVFGGSGLLSSPLSEWEPPVISTPFFLRGPHSELHYCDHFNVDIWIYHSVNLSSPFDGSWLCKNLNKWMSILFKEKQKYHATEEIYYQMLFRKHLSCTSLFFLIT